MPKYFQAAITLLLSGIYEYKSEHIDCSGTDQCYNDDIKCRVNEDCIILCNGDSACAFSTVLCPETESTKCSLICNDTLSCNHLTISALNVSSLDVTGNGYESLSFAEIYCPLHSTSNWCKVSYFGNQNGLNMMNIYTPFNYNAISVECHSNDSTTGCWSSHNNPTIHYGDSMYSNICIIDGSSDCRGFIYSTLFGTTRDGRTDNILSNTFGHKVITEYEFDIILLLLSLGTVLGVVISVCCCILYRCVPYYCTKSPSTSVTNANSSPSLRILTPKLSPTDLLHNSDTLPEHSEDNVVVTVQKYSNAENKCDESIVLSRMSSLWSPTFKMDLSECIGRETAGIAPDEFVVCGDTPH